jgi:hypothetical protein
MMSKTILQSEQEYIMTFVNRVGEEVTPMFPVKESEMATWVESFQAEGKFISFKEL